MVKTTARVPMACALFALAICSGCSASADPPADGASSSNGTSGNPATPAPSVDPGRSGMTDPATTPPAGDVDGGTDAASPPSGDDAFKGAAAFVAGTGGNTSQLQHILKVGNLNPAQKECLNCHGSGNKLLMFAGGTVYKDAAGATPAASVEVRLRNATTGKAVSAYTDALGNFFVRSSEAATAGVTQPVIVGVRDATTSKSMVAAPKDGGCNAGTCHGGPQGWAHL